MYDEKYDIIFIVGEQFFDHPLCGVAILKRYLEKNGFSVGVIEEPREEDITKLGRPRLFFGVSSGSMDSMLRNYSPLKRLRLDDPNVEYIGGFVPDRAVIVYCNWIRKHFKDTLMVIGGTEVTMRRFSHYDYWDNALRKPILVDSRADIMCYGNSEKQLLEVAQRIRKSLNENSPNEKARLINVRESLKGILGTCIISKDIPAGFVEIPSFEEVSKSIHKFCDMQNLFSNEKNLAQKVQDRYVLQYKMPGYTSKDLDEYYEEHYTRHIPSTMRHLFGFEFSVVTHRGCVGNCNFCSLTLTQGRNIISRSEESILRELKYITTLPRFSGDIDDLGGPAANMYGMDCGKCSNDCLTCKNLSRDNKRMIELLVKAKKIPGIKHIYIKSGIRYDLCSHDYLKEIIAHHTADTLRIAPEHVNRDVLKLMNKDFGNLQEFIKTFDKIVKEINSKSKLSFYFMTAHPGSTIDNARELSKFTKNLENAESLQIFTPTPMTVSTCMYYTGLDPKTRKKIYVPYTYIEKKAQKKVIMGGMKNLE